MRSGLAPQIDGYGGALIKRPWRTRSIPGLVFWLRNPAVSLHTILNKQNPTYV